MDLKFSRGHKCVSVHAFLQLCKVGDLVRDPSVSQPTLHRPVHFYFSGSAGSGCTFPHCYLSSRRKQLQFLLDVFLCLFGTVPFNASREGKNRSTCGYMRVYCVSLCVCVCVSKHRVVVRGLGEGGLLPINQTPYKQT